MKINIKNLGDPASKYFVKAELERQGILFGSFEAGGVEIANEISEEQMNTLIGTLKKKYGLDVIIERKETSIGEMMKGSEMRKSFYQFSKWGI